MARALMGLGGIALLGGERERARTLYAEALEICERTENPQERANVRYRMLELLVTDDLANALVVHRPHEEPPALSSVVEELARTL